MLLGKQKNRVVMDQYYLMTLHPSEERKLQLLITIQ
jgi:hypothetical protein